MIMNKLKLFLSGWFFLLISFVAVGEEYCAPVFSKGRTVGYPVKVETTGATTNLDYSPDAEEYKNALVGSTIEVKPGETLSLSIGTVKARWGVVRVYMDLNGDGVFDEDTERLGVFGDTSDGNNEVNLATIHVPEFTIPSDYTGNELTRLRILFSDGDTKTNTTACGSYIDGGFFDFGVKVLRPVDYCAPVFTKNPAVGYLSSAKTTGASVNLDYLTNEFSYKNAVTGNRISVMQGEEIELNLHTVSARWGIVNVYVDLDGDGGFSGDGEFLASFGDPHNKSTNETDLATIQVPSFTIPQGLPVNSIVRLRVIFSGGTAQQVETQKLAGGCDTYAEGGYYDFEMEVKADIKMYAVNYQGTVTGGSFAVKRGSEIIPSGTSLPEGTILSIETTVDQGYELAGIQVNGAAIVGNTFALQGETTVEVEIIETIAGTAVRIPSQDGNTVYQLRFSDALLGTHTINSAANDQRVRNITFSAWVKALSTSGELFGYMQKAFYGADGAFSAFLENGKLGIRNRYWVDGGNCPGQKDVLSDAELTNQWAFITYVINDADKKISLYKDGVKVAERTLDGKGIGYLVDDCILYCGNKGFAGDFDEIQIWDKVLTDIEINESMAGYSGTIPENLIYYYHFGDPSAAGMFSNKAATTCDAALYRGIKSESNFQSPTVVSDPQLVLGHYLEQFVLTYEGVVSGGSFEVVDAEGGIVKSNTLLRKGSYLSVRVSPEEGYQLMAIKVNGLSIEGDSFFLAEDVSVTVDLTNELQLLYTATTGGSILVTDAKSKAIENNSFFLVGEDLSVCLSVDEGYEITSFTVNGEDKMGELADGVFLIPNCLTNLTVEAAFEQKKYPLTISVGEQGSLTVKNGAQTVNDGDLIVHGTVLTIYLSPADKETMVESFTINDVDRLPELVANTLMYTMTAAADIVVTFKKESFTIVSSVTGNGVLKAYIDDEEIASGSIVEKGSYIQLLVTPGAGEKFIRLTVNEEDITADVYEGEVWIEVSGSMLVQAEFSGTSSMERPDKANKVVEYLPSFGEIRTFGCLGDRILLYDIAGKLITSSRLSSESFDVSCLAKGCYLCKLIPDYGIGLTLKFIKN